MGQWMLIAPCNSIVAQSKPIQEHNLIRVKPTCKSIRREQANEILSDSYASRLPFFSFVTFFCTTAKTASFPDRTPRVNPDVPLLHQTLLHDLCIYIARYTNEQCFPFAFSLTDPMKALIK
jgi:hypothetical protein